MVIQEANLERFYPSTFPGDDKNIINVYFETLQSEGQPKTVLICYNSIHNSYKGVFISCAVASGGIPE